MDVKDNDMELRPQKEDRQEVADNPALLIRKFKMHLPMPGRPNERRKCPKCGDGLLQTTLGFLRCDKCDYAEEHQSDVLDGKRDLHVRWDK
jgi:DNA-directed RNA polymerase subunit M/transcription elongation factor TFIIS